MSQDICQQPLWAGSTDHSLGLMRCFSGVSMLKFLAVCSDRVEMEMLRFLLPVGVYTVLGF